MSISEIPKGSHALYLGNEEKEWLLPSHTNFLITEIQPALIGGKKGLIYKLEKTN